MSTVDPMFAISSAGAATTVPGLVAYAVGALVVIVAFDYLLGWTERKVMAKVQARRGPTMTGDYGFLQNLADFVKLVSKADFVPERAQKALYVVSLPLLLAGAVFLVLMLPLFPGIAAGDLSAGMLAVFAILAFMPIAAFANGFSSGNKFAGIDVQRMLVSAMSYEGPALAALAAVGMMAGGYSVSAITAGQVHYWYALTMPLGLVVMFVAMTAVTGRSPYDVYKEEAELGAGWFTDMSAPRYAMATFARYTKMMLSGLVIAILFLGGWAGPVLPQWLWLLVKGFAVAVAMVLARALSLRMQPGRAQRLGLQILAPLALLNLIITYVIFVR